MPEPDPSDSVLDNQLQVKLVTDDGGDDVPEANMAYWQEKLYAQSDKYDSDAKFFENALKSAHLEGKMSAREMTFAKGGGLPTVMPLPANQNTAPVPGA